MDTLRQLYVCTEYTFNKAINHNNYQPDNSIGLIAEKYARKLLILEKLADEFGWNAIIAPYDLKKEGFYD